jgi:hypothetical protein
MSDASLAPARDPAGPAGWRGTDWTLRPFAATSRSPLWIALALSAAWVAASLVVLGLALALGFPREQVFTADSAFGSALVTAALFGYMPAALAYLHRGVGRDLAELRPCLAGPDADVDALAAELCSPRGLCLAGALGAVVGVAIALFDPVLEQAYRGASRLDPRFLWFVAGNAILIFLGARLFATELHMTRAYARLGGRVAVDLLDLRPLAAFGRKGQRSVVLWAALSSLFSGYWLLGSAGETNLVFALLLLAVVSTAFLAPALGLRSNLRAVKSAELVRVRERLRLERERLLAPQPPRDSAPSRAGELIAWLRLVERVPEWPFDTPALLRALLFTALGIGSWLGGALVERALDALLGGSGGP